MTDHKHGSMSTRVQQKTFEGFLKFSKNSVIVFIFIMLFLAVFNS